MVLAEILVIILSAIPLYFAVKLMGGRTTILKTILVAFLGAVIFAAIDYIFSSFAAIIAFILLIWVYHEVFRLGWIKSVLAWLLQFVIIWIVLVLLGLLGITIGLLSIL